MTMPLTAHQRIALARRFPDGRPFLPASLVTNSKGAARAYFEVGDVERFASAHVELKDLAEERGGAAKILRA